MTADKIIPLAFGTFILSGAWFSPAVLADEGASAANGSGFAPTIANQTPAPKNAPEGMVWIPGGEFSMGCKVPSEGVCTMATMNAVNDAQPIHRVYVDGFWMDTNDVTNEKFEQFVKATGYETVAEIVPTKEQFPTAPPENLVAGSTVFTPTAQRRAAGRLFPVVALCAGRELASSHRAGQRSQGQGKLSGCANRLRRRGGLREVGGKTIADGGGMGICRAWRIDRQNLFLGR